MGKSISKPTKTTHTKGANKQPINSTKAIKRLEVQKTYKLYIGGKYPRTESGRYYSLQDASGNHIAHVCRASRKDFRNAVVAARKAQNGWAGRSAYNRGQILYRMAEILEGRKEQFVQELLQLGLSPADAEKNVTQSIDRMIYYAGWTDKYQQLFSSVNPVASSHFNFSLPEPTGVVSIIAPQAGGLCGLVSTLLPVLAGGNTSVVLAGQSLATVAISFAEVLSVSDLPAGVINMLTGYEDELLSHFASHMDVNAIIYAGNTPENWKQIQELATLNVKRVIQHDLQDWLSDQAETPYWIMETQEIKTTWHPVGT